ncbi:NAD(P)H-binding protein [Nocardioides maradonensis]
MTSIAIIGGTGYAGSHIAREAADRGLDVTTVSRSAADTPAGITHEVGSLADTALVNELAAKHDVLVVAVHATGEPDLRTALPTLVEAARTGGARLAFVGGAGSMLVAEGGPRLVDTDGFPDEYKAEALAHGEVLDALRADTSDLKWFYVSPAAVFGAWAPGEATGSYRVSEDVLLTDANGDSQVGGADFAKAFVDEITAPRFENRRFQVAY